MKESLTSKKIFFKEEQRFSQSPMMWILYTVFLVSVLPIVIGMYQQFVLGKPWGDEPMSDKNLIFTFIFIFILMGALLILFGRVKLQVRIDEDGIHYRFPFFVIREKTIPFESIEHYEIRKYKPILDYGGWGYKQGFHRKFKRINKWGNGMTVRGKIGLQLYFKDGGRLLIGTQHGEAIRRAMDKIMREEKEKTRY